MLDGYWVQYWVMRRQSQTPTKIVYKFMQYKHGYTDKHKNDDYIWKDQAENWAQNSGGWSSSSYTYGYKFVNLPKEWILEKINKHKEQLSFYETRLKEIC